MDAQLQLARIAVDDRRHRADLGPMHHHGQGGVVAQGMVIDDNLRDAIVRQRVVASARLRVAERDDGERPPLDGLDGLS